MLKIKNNKEAELVKEFQETVVKYGKEDYRTIKIANRLYVIFNKERGGGVSMKEFIRAGVYGEIKR